MSGALDGSEFAHISTLIGKAIEKVGSTYNLRMVSGELSGYVLSNKDDDLTPNYYGYLARDGSWYIMKEVVATGDDVYTFVKGTTGYAAAWVGRAALSYDAYNVIFG